VNRWIRLGIIGGVIIALVVVLVVLQSQPDEEQPQASAPDPERVALFEFPRESIDRITVRQGESTLEVARRDDDTFSPVYRYDVKFATSRVNRIVSGASSLTSRRIIDENPADLSQYGLASPADEISVAAAGEAGATLLIGDQTPARDSYYVKLQGAPTIYTVYNTWISPFLYTLDELRDKSLPAIDTAALSELLIRNIEGRVIHVEKVPEDDTDPEMALTAYVVTEPYARRVALNTTWIEDISTAYTALRIVRYVDDAPENLGIYGLDPPAARVFIADSDSSADIVVGNEAEGGRYARLVGTPSVFVISGIEEIVTTRPYEAISAFALIVGIDLVDRFVLETPTESFEGRIEREPAEDPDEDPTETFFINGVQIDEDLFRDLYQYSIGLLVDGEAEAPQYSNFVARIPYFLNEGSQPLSVEFVPYDSNYLAVYREGRSEFLISRAKVERTIEAFQEAVVQ